MERLGRNRHVAGALSAIGAVVTAVIAFLALWFTGNVFLPHGTIAAGSLVIAVAALLLMQLQKVGMIPLILGCGLTGVLFRMIQ
ncbi:MAG: chromate transporter, partial [Verrucomicrobiota bacterium]